MRRYGALVAIPGVRAPLVLSTLGSMPIGMFGLATLLLAYDVTGSFAQAGRVAGAFSLANAAGALVQGRLMDRAGQTTVLRVAAAGHLPALIGLVIAAHEHASAWVLSLFALAGGATFPQLPAAMRSLWNALVSDPEQRATAYALVAVVFEVAVVTAPALVALIVALSSPSTAVVVAAALGVGSAVGFTTTRASRRWRGERHEAGWLGPFAAPGMRTVFAVLAVFGTAVGIVQVAVPAFASERGSAAAGGVLLAALSAGSLAGGLAYGARTWPGRPPTRLAVLMLTLGATFALLAVATTEPVLGMLLILSGLLFAPTTVVGSTLLDTVAPAGTVTEAFAAMVMGIVAGTAVGNALGGSLVEASSYDAAVLIAGAIAAAGSGLAVIRRQTLSPRGPLSHSGGAARHGDMSTKIAVAGATGRIGTHIVDVLTERGHEVVPMSRRTGVDVTTGEGLDAALKGVEIIIDATTSPNPDEQEATAFFTASARSLQAAAAKAGVRRIVIISIVGTDRFHSGYNAAKNAQEAAILEGPVEARIVRAAQFHEFVDALMQWGRQGDKIAVWGMQTQLVGARAAAEAVVDVALEPELADGPVVEVAGPRAERLVEVARLKAAHDGDSVSVEEGDAPADPELYAGGALLPGPGARLVGPTYSDWLTAA